MIDSVGQRLRVRWRELSMGSANRRIFGAAVTVGGLTLAGSLVSMGKELLVAASFGTSDALDAFLIAFLLPSFIINVVAGSFGSALVPAYVQARDRDGNAAAQRVVSGIMVLSLGLLIGTMVLLALVRSSVIPLVAAGFSPAKLQLTGRLYYMLLPTIVLSGLASIWGALLNAGERFALAAFTPAIVPIATATALWLLRPTWGIYALVFGIVAGYGVQFYLLGRALMRQGLSLRPRWHGLDPNMRQVVGQYVPMVAGAILMSSTLLVDQSIAARLGPGSVSVLAYGNKAIGLVLALGATAVRTATLPYFSRMAAERDWLGVRHTVRTYTLLILIASIPITALLFVFTAPIARIMFERGAFTAEDARLVGQVQAMYALQLPFYLLGSLLTPLISSLRANRLLLMGATISSPLNILLDNVLSRFLGVAGIALATSGVYVVSWFYLTVSSYRLIRRAERDK